MALNTKTGIEGAIYMESATTGMTDEACTASGSNTIYTITADAKQYISMDPAVLPVVKYDGDVVASTTYTINYALGVITFASTPGVANVTITGSYITMTLLPGFTKFSVDTSVGTHDVTQFVATTDEDYGWKRIIGALGEWNATADGFLQDDDILSLVAVAVSSTKHFKFSLDQTLESYYYGLGSVNKCDIDDSVAGVITQNLGIASSSTLVRVSA